jgi:hypothetical protein
MKVEVMLGRKILKDTQNKNEWTAGQDLDLIVVGNPSEVERFLELIKQYYVLMN